MVLKSLIMAKSTGLDIVIIPRLKLTKHCKQ